MMAVEASPSRPRYTARWLDSPFVCVPPVAIAYVLLLLYRVAPYGYDLSALITLGDRFANPALTPPNVKIHERSPGYDGQFYYRVALDPFTSERTAHGIVLDHPAYRHQRILYPLTAWALALGRRDAIPTTLVIVNLFSLCGIAYLGGVYAQLVGRHPLWGLAFPLYPGFVLSLVRDLSEILAAGMLLGSLVALRCRAHNLATTFIVLAVLARETAMLAVAGAFGALVYQRFVTRSEFALPVRFVVVPSAVFVSWQIVMFFNWGTLTAVGVRAFDAPVIAFVDFLRSVAAFDTYVRKVWLIEVLGLIVFGGSVLWATLRSIGDSLYERTSWLLYTILILTLGRAVWVEDWAFLRATSEFYTFGTAVLLGSRTAVMLPAFAAMGASLAVLVRSFLLARH